MAKQMELFSKGGLRDEGGKVESKSGNQVPSGSLKEEVADDIPVMISEGEFVFPADVVRYIGLETLMKMRQDAKQGLKMMEKMGQMGNPEEAELPDDIPFGMADLIVVSGEMKKDDDKEEKAEGGVVGLQRGGGDFGNKDMMQRLIDMGAADPIDRGLAGPIGDPNFPDGDFVDPRFGDLPEDSPLRDPRFVDAFPKDRFKDDPVLRDPRALPIEDEPRGGGGLFDDPRFRDQKRREVPTYTEEDEKALTESLLGTAYGDVVMKRYVGPDGEVMYVPFINGEPQLSIPEGFKEDSEAPSAPTTSVSPSRDDRQEDEAERARGDNILAPPQPMTVEKPVLLTRTDGTKITNINQMTTNELVDYYESFNSNINRYASALGALFFGPVGGLIIGSAQTINNKYGVNGLSSVEKLLSQKKDLTAAQRAKLSKIAGELKQKGAGGLSIVRTVTNALGLTKEEGKGKTEFQKSIEKGNISGAIDGIKSPLTLNQLKGDGKQQVQDLANQTLNMPSTLGVTSQQAEQFKKEQQMKDVFKFGRGRAEPVERVGGATPVSLALGEVKSRRAVTDAGIDAGPELSLQEMRAMGMIETVGKRADRLERERLERERLERERLEQERLEQERIEKERFEREQERLERERKRKEEQAAQQAAQQAAAEKARRDREEQEKQIYQSSPTDRDEDSGGDQDSSDDFGFQTELPSYSQPSFTPQQQADAYTQSAVSDFQSGAGGFGFGGRGFYVGGVPTKPMKPQRLKKGGLAKMKVKPKRMKKGGLASRKK